MKKTEAGSQKSEVSLTEENLSPLLVGHIYHLDHCRFGQATVKVLEVYDEWAQCEIVSGTLRGATDDWEKGEVKSFRIAHGKWELGGSLTD